MGKIRTQGRAQFTQTKPRQEQQPTRTTKKMMTTKAAALALALAAAILCVAQAQLPDVGSLAQTAILGEVNKAVGSGFLCNSGASSGLIDALPGSGPVSLLNSIFGLGVEQGYRWATSSGPLTGVNGLTGC